MYRLDYEYNRRGFGELRLMDSDSVVDQYTARTGSIRRDGKLVNAIPPDTWEILEMPVATTEVGMWIAGPHHGWKVRLYRHGKYTRYLIHPDGGLPGSKGCIAIQGTDAVGFCLELADVVGRQSKISVNITKGDPYANR